MRKIHVDPVTSYLRAYNGAANNEQGRPPMDGLSTSERVRVEAFLERANPQGRAALPQKPNEVIVSSGPQPEQFAIGDENAAKLREILGNLAVQDTAISTQPQQGEQQ